MAIGRNGALPEISPSLRQADASVCMYVYLNLKIFWSPIYHSPFFDFILFFILFSLFSPFLFLRVDKTYWFQQINIFFFNSTKAHVIFVLSNVFRFLFSSFSPILFCMLNRKKHNFSWLIQLHFQITFNKEIKISL